MVAVVMAMSPAVAGEPPKCVHPVSIYRGVINIDATDYLHTVKKGGDYVKAPIDGLDRMVSSAPRGRFWLDYPFEKPFAGVVEGKVTLRAVIDAIRAGFRKMYEGVVIRDIPGMGNKNVTGPYGKSFHVISDLVIESIDLCDGDILAIYIGS
ncbi:MAG: hypothetical protein NVSMB23_14210 [Myxococcales bacterium]